MQELEQRVAKFARRIKIPVAAEARERTLLGSSHASASAFAPRSPGEPALREIELARCVQERSGSAVAGGGSGGAARSRGTARPSSGH